MSIFKAFFGLGKIPKVTKFFEFKSFDDVNQTGGAIANIKQQVREGGLQLTKAQQKFLDDQQKQVEMVFEQISKSSQSGIRNAESAKIFDLKGQKLDPNQPIIGGTQPKNTTGSLMSVPKKKGFAGMEYELAKKSTDTNQIIKKITSMEPVEAMKEANNVIKREGIYKNLNEKEAKKILKDTEDWIFQRDPDDLYDYKNKRPFRDDPDYDPENMATGGRAGFKMGRRAFLKLMGGVGAGIGALKTGLLKLTGTKGATVAKEITSVPIKNIEGMPAWFKPLVNKVIKEGEDVTEKFAFKDRQIVHKTKLPDSGTDVAVTQDLDTGDVLVDIGLEKHGFASGKYGQPVRLEYKAAEIIEPDIDAAGKIRSRGGKTKEEFNVEEAEFTGGSPENVKFEDSSVNKFGEHESDFSEVEAFATGKRKKDARKVSESFDKQNEDVADLFSNYPEPDDFASGGIAGMVNKRFDFDSGGSPLQRLRQSIVNDLLKNVPGIPEADLQILVKDINLDMSPEEAQASIKANFLQLYGKAQGGLAGMLGE